MARADSRSSGSPDSYAIGQVPEQGTGGIGHVFFGTEVGVAVAAASTAPVSALETPAILVELTRSPQRSPSSQNQMPPLVPGSPPLTPKPVTLRTSRGCCCVVRRGATCCHYGLRHRSGGSPHLPSAFIMKSMTAVEVRVCALDSGEVSDEAGRGAGPKTWYASSLNCCSWPPLTLE